MVGIPKTGTIVTIVLIIVGAAYVLIPRAPPAGGELVIVQSTDADILDPTLTVYDSATRVTSLIFDTLMYFDYDMSYKPLLAESWEIDPGGLSVTFHLKRGVKFHCGEPFTAEAVRYTVERAKNHPKSKHRDSVASIREVEIIDDYTVRVHFDKQDRYVFDWFATISSVIICPHHAELYGEEYGVTKVCGTGPFKFKQWIREDRIILERNEDYTWGPSIYQNRGPAKLEGITIRVIPEELVRQTEFEAGRVQFLVHVPFRTELWDKWRTDPKFKDNIVLIQRPFTSAVYLGFNVSSPTLSEPATPQYAGKKYSLPATAKPSPCNDVRVRKALNYATYKENLVKYAYEGVGKPMTQFLVSLMWGYNPYIENMYPYDPERARSLLREAGYENKDLKLQLLTTSAPPYPRLAELLREQWKVVGVDLDIQVVEFGYLIEQITKCTFDMFIMGYTWHNADMIWWIWHRIRLPGGPNRMWWGSYYSDLVIENTFLLDDNKALEAIYESSRLIMEDAGCIPLVERGLILAHRAEVKDYIVHPLGDRYWKHLDTYVKKAEE